MSVCVIKTNILHNKQIILFTTNIPKIVEIYKCSIFMNKLLKIW